MAASGCFGDLVKLVTNLDILSSTQFSEPINSNLESLKDKGIVNLISSLAKETSPWQIGYTKSLHCLIRSGTEAWIQPVVPKYRNSPEFRSNLETVLQKMLSAAHIPKFSEREIFKYDQSDFEFAEARATHAMELLRTIFKLLVNVQAADIVVRDVMKMVGKDLIILITSNMEARPWTSNQSVKSAEDLLNCLMEMYVCTSLGELLVIDPSERAFNADHVTSSSTLFRQTLKELQPRVNKGNWKRNPSFVASSVQCLFLLGLPHVGDYLDYVVPFSLSLVDDYVLENKVLGVRCLQHIITNTTKTELQWQGRGEVIYEAVKHQLYVHEVDLVRVAHPCILAILKVVETSPKTNGNVTKTNRYDEIFSMILFDSEMETKLVLRCAYTCHLSDFIEDLGLRVVKHSKQLLRVIASYLETNDGPQEIARLNMLAVLRRYIIEAWPRVPSHSATLLKCVLRLLYDLSIDEKLSSQSVKQTLIEKLTEILILLKCACKKDVEECLCKMLKVNTSPLCVQVMQKVLHVDPGMCCHENAA